MCIRKLLWSPFFSFDSKKKLKTIPCVWHLSIILTLCCSHSRYDLMSCGVIWAAEAVRRDFKNLKVCRGTQLWARDILSDYIFNMASQWKDSGPELPSISLIAEIAGLAETIQSTVGRWGIQVARLLQDSSCDRICYIPPEREGENR